MRRQFVRLTPAPYGLIGTKEAEEFVLARPDIYYQMKVPSAMKGGRRLHFIEDFVRELLQREPHGIDGRGQIVAVIVAQYLHWQALRGAPGTPPAVRRAALHKERQTCEEAGIPFREDDYPIITEMLSSGSERRSRLKAAE